MLTAWSFSPVHTRRIPSTVAPTTAADASCIPKKTGLSSLPSPCAGSAAPIGSAPARRTAPMYSAECTNRSNASSQPAGGTTWQCGPSSSPRSPARR